MSKEDIEIMKTLQELENSLNQLANKCIEMGKETATAIAVEQLKQPIVFMFMKSLKENEANKKRIEELEEERKLLNAEYVDNIPEGQLIGINKLQYKEYLYLRRNSKTLNYGKKLGRIELCKELLKDGGN